MSATEAWIVLAASLACGGLLVLIAIQQWLLSNLHQRVKRLEDRQ